MRAFGLAAALFASLACVTPLSAQTLEESMNICMNGAGQVSNEEITTACTNLIDQAQAENETIGFFYAMRALANTDRERNCSDGLKAKELIKDPNLADPIEQIIANNC